MRLSNLGGVGITGIFAVFTGLFLLWRHRSDILSWFTAYILRLRSELVRRGAFVSGINDADAERESNPIRLEWPHSALAIVAGICLILGGQLALYVDLLS